MNGSGSLETLFLQNNQFTGNLSVGSVPSLRSLRVDGNRLNGSIPSDLAELLPDLRWLNATANLFFGRLPEFLPPRLFAAQLALNAFTGSA